MDQNQPELTLEESVKQVMQTLPPVIRDYLAAGRYTAVAKSLALKYNLRIDQAGVLERELMLLLMGIENPTEFTEALAQEANLGQEVIGGIVEDVNAQVFVPLREEEMRSSRPAPVETKSQESSQRFMHLDNRIPPPASSVAQSRPPAPLRATQGAVQNPGLRSVLASVTSEVKADRLLEDHEEPHIEFNTAPSGVGPVIPKAEPQAPQNLPGALPPVLVPPLAETVTPPAPPVRPQPLPPPAPAKPYSVDPYREPLE